MLLVTFNVIIANIFKRNEKINKTTIVLINKNTALHYRQLSGDSMQGGLLTAAFYSHE